MLTRRYYQYYTNVTYLTCPECLSWHGKIARRPQGLPDRKDGCERRLLAFSPRELDYHREQERRMRAAAEAELVRRDLLAQASDALGSDNDVALSLFRQAVAVDLHVPEVEALREKRREPLEADPALRRSLRALFAKAYSDKFGHPRYERLPEEMRLARERAGIARINELLA